MSLKRLIPVLCSTVLFAACSKNSPTGPAANTFIKANAGSSFTFDEYSTDSTNAIIPGMRDTVVSTILRTDGAIAGKTGVLIVENVRGSEMDTSYYAYEANNNVSVLAASESTGEPVWMTLPVGTGTTLVTATADTSEDQGIVTIVRDSSIASVLSTQTMTVKGASVLTQKVQLSFGESIAVNGVAGSTQKADNLFYYAPSLGFMAGTNSPSRPDPFGGWIDGSIQTLIDYYVN